ncbi:unnamed protein product [Ectocarpus sp. 13 AM-2016]
MDCFALLGNRIQNYVDFKDETTYLSTTFIDCSTHVACVALLSLHTSPTKPTVVHLASHPVPYFVISVPCFATSIPPGCTLSVPDGNKLAPYTPTPIGIHETAYLAANANETCTWTSSRHEKNEQKMPSPDE